MIRKLAVAGAVVTALSLSVAYLLPRDVDRPAKPGMAHEEEEDGLGDAHGA